MLTRYTPMLATNMCRCSCRHEPYPLSKSLKNGQTIEISAPGARPNAAWLNYVVTSRARTKIRQVLKTMRREESITLGRRLLNHALVNTLLPMSAKKTSSMYCQTYA
ncbi:hypothetical protein O9993_04345 [Vibrio lentus]|nr:hypothetical protein [Vibrio lentus]